MTATTRRPRLGPVVGRYAGHEFSQSFNRKDIFDVIINTFSYLWSATAIDAIAELVDNGYKTFEIPISSPHCWPDELSTAERSTMKARLGDHGATVRSLNAGGYDVNLASPAANMRRKSIEHIKSVIDLAVAWDAPDVVISPGTIRPIISPPIDKAYEWLYESLGDLIPLAKEAGKRLLFENTPYCFTPTIEELAAVVQTADDDALKIVWDVANAAYIQDDPVAGLLSHHEHIGLVHISDTGLETWGHDPIGTGVVDWVELGGAVEATCGVGNVVLEIIREENPVHVFNQAMDDLKNRGWKLGD